MPKTGDLVVLVDDGFERDVGPYIWLGKPLSHYVPEMYSVWHLKTASEGYLESRRVRVIQPFSECVNVDA